MEAEKALVEKKVMVMPLVQFTSLLAVATLAPVIFSHFQIVTGPIVNATLFIAVGLIGTRYALLIGLVPSVIALSTGLLPAPLAPMIPFIMLSNSILIIVFSWFIKKRFWTGVAISSVLKFGFLFATSSVVIGLLTKSELAGKVATILGWPQLLTALAGGIIAFGVLKALKKV